MIEVIGAGLPRTGTISLRAALGELGIAPCYHMEEVFRRPQDVALWEAARTGGPEWASALAGYRATMDAPACFFWRELVAAYPAAKVILTVRDPVAWYESFMSTVFLAMSEPERFGPAAPALRMAHRYVVEDFLGGAAEDRGRALAAYAAHVSAVKAGAPADRLLVYDLAEGWAPLCAFLGRPRPEAPMPHRNDRSAFRGRLGLA